MHSETHSFTSSVDWLEFVTNTDIIWSKLMILGRHLIFNIKITLYKISRKVRLLFWKNVAIGFSYKNKF